AGKIEEGTKAPDFNATNIDGKEVKLSDWVGKKQLVVVFSRAHWCPFCMGQLKDLQNHYKEISKAGGEVIVVFREEQDGVEGLKESQKVASAEFPLLLDLGAKATADYGTTGYTTYIIDKAGNVKKILSGQKRDRPKAEEIIAALKS
ncbi:MAG: peroxiredoxin family protein, partial [Planctomycetes bacterium]|nr:peroxiredoxin family protein [Planctomycetota bacterium]